MQSVVSKPGLEAFQEIENLMKEKTYITVTPEVSHNRPTSNKSLVMCEQEDK